MDAIVYPDLLRGFLHKADWPPPCDATIAQRMQTALEFFHGYLQSWIDRPLDANDKGYQTHGFNLFAFTMGGKVTKLTSAMQGINFTHPVTTPALTRGQQVVRYGKPGEPRGGPASGLWYTDGDVPAYRLALPPDQTSPYYYELVAPVKVLASIAGDMLVDWNMSVEGGKNPVRGVDYHYRSGGGVQYVIPNAATVLRPL